MLEGSICSVTAIISAVGVIVAAFFAFRSKNKPIASQFGAVTAFIFAGQMMNFSIQNGTSGHLLGAVLAVTLLGLPFGILSMAVVVTSQCLIFSDGGTAVLGANILNMSLIGSAAAGMFHCIFSKKLKKGSIKYAISLGMVSWMSIMMAALACSIELSLAGTISFLKVVGAMLNTHAIIGIGEAGITVAAYYLFASNIMTVSRKKSVVVPLFSAGIIAVLLSPFASGFPDGLEWVAAKYNFLHESAPTFVTPFSDYAISFISNEVVSTSLAGLSGVVFTFFMAWGVFALVDSFKCKRVKQYC